MRNLSLRLFPYFARAGHIYHSLDSLFHSYKMITSLLRSLTLLPFIPISPQFLKALCILFYTHYTLVDIPSLPQKSEHSGFWRLRQFKTWTDDHLYEISQWKLWIVGRKYTVSPLLSLSACDFSREKKYTVFNQDNYNKKRVDINWLLLQWIVGSNQHLLCHIHLVTFTKKVHCT